MNIKITADDFGYCSKRNAGIIESVNKGIVNSVSVLVNGSCVEPCAHLFTKNVKIGLHLNLTEGKPLKTVKSIVDEQGIFFPKKIFTQKLMLFSQDEVHIISHLYLMQITIKLTNLL